MPASNDVNFTIKFLPYQLYPDASKEGEDKYEWYASISHTPIIASQHYTIRLSVLQLCLYHFPLDAYMRYGSRQLLNTNMLYKLSFQSRYKQTKYDDSEEKMQKYVTLMSTYGKDAGIDFNFHGTIANTIDAHRLIQHCQETMSPEAVNKVVDCKSL